MKENTNTTTIQKHYLYKSNEEPVSFTIVKTSVLLMGAETNLLTGSVGYSPPASIERARDEYRRLIAEGYSPTPTVPTPELIDHIKHECFDFADDVAVAEEYGLKTIEDWKQFWAHQTYVDAHKDIHGVKARWTRREEHSSEEWLAMTRKLYSDHPPSEDGTPEGIKKEIPSPPYFSGPGWSDKLNDWTAKNLPSDFSADWRGEAAIAWNVSGGSPSGLYYSEISRAVAAYNAGEEYQTPRADWNAQQIDQQTQIRERM